jgi:hypothetical protein
MNVPVIVPATPTIFELIDDGREVEMLNAIGAPVLIGDAVAGIPVVDAIVAVPAGALLCKAALSPTISSLKGGGLGQQ